MFRFSPSLLAVRQKGRVHWRTPIKRGIEDNNKITPLLMERPYPLADIVKRMVRIKVRCMQSQDSRERQLLRGEYKYFTGKQIDLRGASISDMVACLEAFSFFKFWHVPLGQKIVTALDRASVKLQTEECLSLAKSLPVVVGERYNQHPLFRAITEKLTPDLEDLSVEDVLGLLKALQHRTAVSETPEIVEGCLLLMAATWEPPTGGADSEDSLKPSEIILLLSTIANLPVERALACGFTPSLGRIQSTEEDDGRLAASDFTRGLLMEALNALSSLAIEEISELLHICDVLGVIGGSPTQSRMDFLPPAEIRLQFRSVLKPRLSECSCQGISLACYHLATVPSLMENGAFPLTFNGAAERDYLGSRTFVTKAVDIVLTRLPAMTLAELYSVLHCYVEHVRFAAKYREVAQSQKKKVLTTPASSVATTTSLVVTHSNEPLLVPVEELLLRIDQMLENGSSMAGVDPQYLIGLLSDVADLREFTSSALDNGSVAQPQIRGIITKCCERIVTVHRYFNFRQATQFLLLVSRLVPFQLDASVDVMLKHVAILVSGSTFSSSEAAGNAGKTGPSSTPGSAYNIAMEDHQHQGLGVGNSALSLSPAHCAKAHELFEKQLLPSSSSSSAPLPASSPSNPKFPERYLKTLNTVTLPALKRGAGSSMKA